MQVLCGLYSVALKLFSQKKQFFIILILFVLSFATRFSQIDTAGIQTDAPVWLTRGTAFIRTIFNDSLPDSVFLPELTQRNNILNLMEGDYHLISREYPFTIQVPAPHSGAPSSFLMGISYIFLSTDSGSLSLKILSTIEAMSLPAVVLGSLMVGFIYWISKALFKWQLTRAYIIFDDNNSRLGLIF